MTEDEIKDEMMQLAALLASIIGIEETADFLTDIEISIEEVTMQ